MMRNNWRDDLFLVVTDASTYSPDLENLYEVLMDLQMIDNDERSVELG